MLTKKQLVLHYNCRTWTYHIIFGAEMSTYEKRCGDKFNRLRSVTADCFQRQSIPMSQPFKLCHCGLVDGKTYVRNPCSHTACRGFMEIFPSTISGNHIFVSKVPLMRPTYMKKFIAWCFPKFLFPNFKPWIIGRSLENCMGGRCWGFFSCQISVEPGRQKSAYQNRCLGDHKSYEGSIVFVASLCKAVFPGQESLPKSAGPWSGSTPCCQPSTGWPSGQRCPD